MGATGKPLTATGKPLTASACRRATRGLDDTGIPFTVTTEYDTVTKSNRHTKNQSNVYDIF
jgi:hypothetical protein